MAQKILIVDDEKDLLELLRYNLTQAGFEVREAADGRTAIESAKTRHPDLIILDIMLPDLSGMEICRLLRKDEATRRIPILMLTARAEEVDKISAFESGADDYVTKPFSPREIILRVRAILRRLEPEIENMVFSVGDLKVDLPAHSVRLKDKPINLTATEFRLLAHLFQNRGRVIERDRLLDKVWGIEADVFTRTVDTHVTRLREKLGLEGRRIETVRGMGYRFSSDD